MAKRYRETKCHLRKKEKELREIFCFMIKVWQSTIRNSIKGKTFKQKNKQITWKKKLKFYKIYSHWERERNRNEIDRKQKCW